MSQTQEIYLKLCFFFIKYLHFCIKNSQICKTNFEYRLVLNIAMEEISILFSYVYNDY